MGTFDFPPPSNDVKFMSFFLNHPEAAILQVSSFRITYFNDLWTLPSPSTSMEGIGNPGMVIPLSAI
jgi:hypothetical protein